MDHLQTRLEALEQRTHTVERQLRWYRRLTCGLGVLGLIGWTLQAVTAGDGKALSFPDRFAALERKLATVSFDAATNEVVITGANLRLLNGLGSTETTNGLGNLIVGYNEPREGGEDRRTGSHTVVVGKQHNFSSVGGLIVGLQNEISGAFAVVSGGGGNTASGNLSSVSGGHNRTAAREFDWVAGSLFEDE
jgi:hypothetical protein